MTTLSHLRRSALRLPEVEEGTRFGLVAFAVRGKRFVSLTKDGLVELPMTDEDADRVLERLAVAEPLTRSGQLIGVRVPLADVDGMELNALLEKAWRSLAPKRLVAPRERAASGMVPAGPDGLPPGLSRPARRALLAAGIDTLSAAVSRSDAELLALHGVGPKAVRLLREAAAERG